MPTNALGSRVRRLIMKTEVPLRVSIRINSGQDRPEGSALSFHVHGCGIDIAQCEDR